MSSLDIIIIIIICLLSCAENVVWFLVVFLCFDDKYVSSDSEMSDLCVYYI